MKKIEYYHKNSDVITYQKIIYDSGYWYEKTYDENGNELTGYDCLKYLCDYIQDTNMNIDNLELRFHTANPVGKENMICYWNNFKKQYGEDL